MEPFISRIRIYPVKSLDPVELTSAEIGIHALLHDRQFAMLANDGRFVNGKRTGKVNELQASYDLSNYLITLKHRSGGESNIFHMVNDRPQIETYLTRFFDLPVHWIENDRGELMDIPTVSSVTMLSDASLETLQADMSDHSLEDLRLRFRINLGVGGAGPYWEEQLFGEPGTGVEFLAGDVKMIGISPRARCNVPPRDPLTGVTDKSFIKAMMKSRSETLPPESKLLEYGNLYQLTTNVYIPESEKGKVIRVADAIRITGTVDVRQE